MTLQYKEFTSIVTPIAVTPTQCEGSIVYDRHQTLSLALGTSSFCLLTDSHVRGTGKPLVDTFAPSYWYSTVHTRTYMHELRNHQFNSHDFVVDHP